MSYTKLFYHIIFRTMQSVPAICENYEKELYHYIWAFCQQKHCVLHRINGMPDHLHLFVEIPPSISVASFVKQLKNATHKWIEKHPYFFPDFYAWSKGYCALSYNQNDKDKISNYIKNQKTHHQKENFDDEIKILLNKHNINITEYFYDDI